MKKAVTFLYRKPAMLFLVFTGIAFLPVLLPFFFLKNDLVTQILPTRFVISESIHSGFFPWWNPYINYGIPQYSDMNAGFWNPVLWVIALLFRYTIWTITYEEIFYIFLSGWGIYLLLIELGVSKKTSILSGFSYMCSGYIIGHMQHFCWITGAAFLPLVFLYFIRVNKNPSAKNFVAGSIMSFLFLSSAHPGLIIGALYFFLFAVAGILLFKKSLLLQKIHPLVLRNNSILLGLSLILSAGVIVSYAGALPFITRGEKLPGENTILNATTLQSYISLLFPLPVHRSAIFNTDISMRNIYIGLFPLPGLYFFYKRFNKKAVLFALAVLVFYILLSAGGIFKTVANTIIPLASYVRSGGEFSLFTVFILVVCGALGLSTVTVTKEKISQWISWLKTATMIFVILLLTGLILLFSTKHSALFSSPPTADHSIKEFLKNTIAALSFWDLLVIQSGVNLASVYFFRKAISRQHKPGMALIISGNLVLVCWLTLPFTGLGAKSKKEVNDLLTPAPPGITNQPLSTISSSATRDSGYINFSGLPYAYMKKMGTPALNPYPIQVKTNAAYFKDSLLVAYINQRSYLFLSTDTATRFIINEDPSAIIVQTTGPGYIKALVRNNKFNYITLLQNDYPYWEVFMDGKKVSHFTGYKTFISARLPRKEVIVEYKFRPRPVIAVAWINLLLLMAALLYLLLIRIRPVAVKNDGKKTEHFP